MNRRSYGNTTLANGLSETRFRALLFVLRLGGIPLNIKSVSAANFVYNSVIIACYYTTMICLYADTFAHRHHLVEAMKKLRVIMGMQGCVWMHISLRYVTVSPECSVVSVVTVHIFLQDSLDEEYSEIRNVPSK
jgi:hypothetical protein